MPPKKAKKQAPPPPPPPKTDEWPCDKCAFLNALAATACQVCSAPKAAPPPPWTCAACTTVNGASAELCDACSLPKAKSDAPPPPPIAEVPIAAVAEEPARPKEAFLERKCPKCKDISLVQRVTKTGANVGRHHIVCVRSCGLFEWCDTF